MSDAQAEAHEALSTAVGSYGTRILGDPRMLGNLVTDLLPDYPRERSLLVAAAEAGIAAELTQHVEGQHVDVDTAIALAARSLTETRSLDLMASMWVATEYAQALGYQTRPQGMPTVTGKAFPLSGADTVAPRAPLATPPVPPPVPVPPVPGAPKSAPSFSPAASPDTRIDMRPAPRFTPTGPQLVQGSPSGAPQPATPPLATSDPAAAPQPAPPPREPWSKPAQNPWQQPAQDPWGQQPPATPPSWPPPAATPPPQPWQPTEVAQAQPPWQPPATPPPWQPPAAAPLNPWPANGGGKPPRKSRTGLLLGGVIAAIIVIYLIVAAVAQTFPFSKSKPSSGSAPRSSPTGTRSAQSTAPGTATSSLKPTSQPKATATPAVTSTATLAAGVKKLKVLLPYDIADASTECVTQAKIPWTNPGLVSAMECDVPDMSGGQVFGYQLDSTANYNKAWHNYNAWAQFGGSGSTNCPPASGKSQGGPVGWFGPRFKKRSGQVIECFTSNSGPVYVWTYPTEDAFIVAQPPKSWSFSKLETWWEDNAA